jgi:hypothetical protein
MAQEVWRHQLLELKALEKENRWLKKTVADLELDKLIRKPRCGSPGPSEARNIRATDLLAKLLG